MFSSTKKIQLGTEKLLEKLHTDSTEVNGLLRSSEINIDDIIANHPDGYTVGVELPLGDLAVNIDGCSNGLISCGDVSVELYSKDEDEKSLNVFSLNSISNLYNQSNDTKRVALSSRLSYFGENVYSTPSDKKQAKTDGISSLINKISKGVASCYQSSEENSSGNGIEITANEKYILNECRKLSESIETLLDEKLGLDAIVIMHLGYKCKTKDELMTFALKLKEILSNTERKLMSNKPLETIPIEHRLRVLDVPALNIIKIVNKNTDNIKTMFTGECSSLVFEALVSYNRYSNTGYIPILLKSAETTSVIHGMVRLKNAENALISYHNRQSGIYGLVVDKVLGVDLTNGISESNEANNNTFADFVVCDSIIHNNSGISLIKLLLAHGENLSESFKAKYI